MHWMQQQLAFIIVKETAASRTPDMFTLNIWEFSAHSDFFYFVYLIRHRNRYEQHYVMCKDQGFASIFMERKKQLSVFLSVFIFAHNLKYLYWIGIKFAAKKNEHLWKSGKNRSNTEKTAAQC